MTEGPRKSAPKATYDPAECGACPWPEWGRHILEELRRLNGTVDQLRAKLEKIGETQLARCEKLHQSVNERVAEVEQEAAADRKRMENHLTGKIGALEVSDAVHGTKLWAVIALTSFLTSSLFAVAMFFLNHAFKA